jgi:hypothetical protein
MANWNGFERWEILAPKPRKPLFEQPDKMFGNLPGDSENVVAGDVEVVEWVGGTK